MIDESELGLETFLSVGVPGIGGKLRRTPEDFVVDEISIRPPEIPMGQYVVARVWHRNWEATSESGEEASASLAPRTDAPWRLN
jgi:tRNA(Glu) U13 pseudouridine synthase TruD